jgi:hypothetical protein
VVPSTPVKPAVSTVEPAHVVPSGVGTVMHSVVSMPMMAVGTGTFRDIDI